MERAVQKLRLDQLVIQQGRATQQSKAASKDELLGMIQHGADKVFQSTESTIDKLDIEDILQHGEEKTKELQQKYAELGLDELQNFSTGGSVQVWQGEDYRQKRMQIGLNWIQPAKRERKQNYDINEYYRDTLRAPRGQGPKNPRGPRQLIA